MQTIECTKDYPLVGNTIKAGSILTELPSDRIGRTSFQSMDNKDIYVFENSEILFSKLFQTSFKLISM